MAKCNLCEKKGLFLKLSRDGICIDCLQNLYDRDVEAANKKFRELEASITPEMRNVQNIQTTIAILESNQLNLQKGYDYKKSEFERQLSELTVRISDASENLSSITSKFESTQKSILSAQKKAEQYKELAVGIQNYYNRYVSSEIDSLPAYFVTQLETLLPDPQLNCLNTKDLRKRYLSLRKQSIEICNSFEGRYTTKANAVIFKLMVLALEAELDCVLLKMNYGKLDSAVASVRELTSKYYAIVSEGNQQIAPTIKRFIAQIENIYIEIVNTEYEYYVQRERAKEEQRALREQMRQEAEEMRRLEAENKKVTAEEDKYKKEMQRITEQIQTAHDAEIESLQKRLAELQASIDDVQHRKAEIVNLQNGKAGTVYVISNIGSFGDNVYKIGMTRRIDPQDRVNELGDASVPFPFDVHSFIFSDDAVSLETALHKELNDRRVNKVNLRKEFFNVSIEELQALVEKHDPTAPFRVTALAEQYRQSLSITDVPDFSEESAIESLDEE